MDDYRYTIRCIHYNINSAETEAPMREFFPARLLINTG